MFRKCPRVRRLSIKPSFRIAIISFNTYSNIQIVLGIIFVSYYRCRSAIVNKNEKKNGVLLVDLEKDMSLLDKQNESFILTDLNIKLNDSKVFNDTIMQLEGNLKTKHNETGSSITTSKATKCLKCGSPVSKTENVVRKY